MQNYFSLLWKVHTIRLNSSLNSKHCVCASVLLKHAWYDLRLVMVTKTFVRFILYILNRVIQTEFNGYEWINFQRATCYTKSTSIKVWKPSKSTHANIWNFEVEKEINEILNEFQTKIIMKKKIQQTVNMVNGLVYCYPKQVSTPFCYVDVHIGIQYERRKKNNS